MIKTFAGKDTENLYAGINPAKFNAFRAQAERQLQMLDAAEDISD
jgi:plasmid maintenance system killer protein